MTFMKTKLYKPKIGKISQIIENNTYGTILSFQNNNKNLHDLHYHFNAFNIFLTFTEILKHFFKFLNFTRTDKDISLL